MADGPAAQLDSLDYGETLTAVARLAVPEYADWCFVELQMPDGRIDRVVMEHVDPTKREFIEEYDRRYPLDAIAEAHAAMEKNENVGKIVIDVSAARTP